MGCDGGRPARRTARRVGDGTPASRPATAASWAPTAGLVADQLAEGVVTAHLGGLALVHDGKLVTTVSRG